MTDMTVVEKIYKSILAYASICAKRTISSMDEVDVLYNEKTYPALNDTIDYIIYGEC